MKSLVLAVAVFGLFTFFVTLSMAAEEGLIGYWSFDEGTVSGKTVKDLSGKKNDGTIMGQPKLVDGKYGKAFKFSGGDDYITVPHSESLDLTKEVTLAAWISPDRFNVWQAILGKGSHERWCYTFFVEPDATVTFEVGRGDKNKPKADWGELEITKQS